jgi:hypothetical protein
LITEYLAVNDSDAFSAAEDVVISLMPEDVPRGKREFSRLRAASIAIVGEIGLVMAKPEAKADVIAALKAQTQPAKP